MAALNPFSVTGGRARTRQQDQRLDANHAVEDEPGLRTSPATPVTSTGPERDIKGAGYLTFDSATGEASIVLVSLKGKDKRSWSDSTSSLTYLDGNHSGYLSEWGGMSRESILPAYEPAAGPRSARDS